MMDNSGEWKTIPTKEARNKEYQLKKMKKDEEIQKKRDGEKREYDEKQKKIKELFAETNKAFNLDKGSKKKYSSHWEVLDEDVDDFTPVGKGLKKSDLAKQTAENGFEFVNQFEKQKKKDQQLQQTKKLKSSGSNSLSNSSNGSSVVAPTNLSKAIQSFDYLGYSALLSSLDTKYPGIIDIQVKLIAERLEEHFGSVPNENINITLNNKISERIDYIPLFKNSNFRKETLKYFDSKPQANLVPSIWFLVNNLLLIYKKDKSAVPTSGIGLEILLQFIFKYYPDNLIKSISLFKTINLSNQKLNILNLFIWFFSQPLSTQPRVSVHLWFELIFPVLMSSSKNKLTEPYICLFDDFSESVFHHEKNKKHIDIKSDVLSTTLEQFLCALQNGEPIPPIALKHSYVFFEVELLFKNGVIPKQYFNVLVNNAAISDEDFRDKILLETVKCLRIDHKCFEYIKEDYSDYIAQVNNLLLFINMKWDELHLYTAIPRSLVYQLGEFAQEQNQKLLVDCRDPKTKKPLKKGKLVAREIEMCMATCTIILDRFCPSKSSSSTLKYLAFFIGLPLTAIGLYFAKQYICQNQSQFQGHHPTSDQLVQKLCSL